MAVDLWAAVTDLNRELLALAPVLFSPTSNRSVAVAMAAGTNNRTATPLRAMRKELAGAGALLVVNVDKCRTTAQVTLGDLPPGSAALPVTVLFEDRLVNATRVNATTVVFQDTFEALDVHVYKWRQS